MFFSAKTLRGVTRWLGALSLSTLHMQKDHDTMAEAKVTVPLPSTKREGFRKTRERATADLWHPRMQG